MNINPPRPPVAEAPPNILFIVVDDAGMDQFEAFGYGGIEPPITHSINAIAEQGVRFRNTWSMPTCSPTRTTYFDGRYPSRNNVLNAVVSNTLATSQMSPYRATLPKVLREHAGYQSALIGKMHITGSEIDPDNHPLGDDAMRELGWDFFAGYLDGAPYPIDTTAGGVGPEGTYQCGFVPNTRANKEVGADFGVCYLAGGEHQVMNNAEEFPTPGKTCIEQGGILDPNATEYSSDRFAELRFDHQNGFYTAEWKINYADGRNETLTAANPLGRGYRTVQEANRSIEWIQGAQEQEGTPWMLSLGFAALHEPLQPPPAHLLPYPDRETSLAGCGDRMEFAQQRLIMQHKLEAIDFEIGRILEETGIAIRQTDGSLEYNPESNTVIVFTTDNGTYMPSVKLPFDPLRAKGSLYQTGIWVPLIVTGNLVASPNRDVPHMINSTDLYRLFLDIAGLDSETLSAELRLDGQPVMPYLLAPEQTAVRDYNFSELGTNDTVEAAPPCVIANANICLQLFPQRQVCTDQSGEWYGPGNDIKPEGFASCCAVNSYFAEQGIEEAELFPESQQAIRDANFKLLQINRLNCETQQLFAVEEFYEVNESPYASQLKLDREENNLLANYAEHELTELQQERLNWLRNKLTELKDGVIDCPGDGDGNLVVDQTDVENWEYWADPERGGGLASWYDLNRDGVTDEADLEIILANMGNVCS
ncbi:MAG: sulfatase-like hydrolase/transferase [Idiomarina sp.]|nr:sulfatase-like hydrolase/transferase [Idiomarina sp.]